MKRIVFKSWLDKIMKGLFILEISVWCMIQDFESFTPILIFAGITLLTAGAVYHHGRNVERLF